MRHIGVYILEFYQSNLRTPKLCQEYLGKEVKMFILPKSNIAHLGVGEWCAMLHRFLEDTKGFLQEYFQRNQSESVFAEDKKRTGWRFAQRKEDRIETAYGLTNLWHNLSWSAA